MFLAGGLLQEFIHHLLENQAPPHPTTRNL